MKSINKIIALQLVLILGAGGCKKELDPVITSSLTPDNFYKTPDDLNNAVIGLYNSFSTNWGTTDQGANIWYASLYNIDRKTYVTRSMLTTDELYVNPDWDPSLVEFTWGPSTYPINGSNPSEPTYPKIRFVARATEVIDKIQKNTIVVDAVKNKYLAEAYTLRAWLMYVLYDFFGPLNVRLNPATLNDTTILPRMTKEAYCAQIESDLKAALSIPSSIFPEYYNKDIGNWGRVSKAVSRMLLLKLYMHNKQWNKAEAAAQDIINMKVYSLLPVYADVFNNQANNEIIYALPCNSASPNYWLAPLFPGEFSTANAGTTLVNAKINGWYGFWMPWSFYDKFDTIDKRRSTIISSYTGLVSGKPRVRTRQAPGPMLGAIPMKYTKVSSSDVGPIFTMDWVVFRYAEVLLSLAEAVNEQRGPSEAYQYVNAVRTRAGVAEWNSINVPTQAAFRDSLLEERGRELYCEGTRRQDLIRHGKFIEYALARGASGASAKDTLFPIPSSVIIESRGIVEQNNGY